MVDWYVVLAPLATVPIVMLLVFLGCQVVFPLDPASYIEIRLDISPGCDTVASAIAVSFSSFINDETFSTTVPAPSSEGTFVATEDLKIALEDEGDVWCGVTITPISGDAFNLLPAGKTKLEDQVLDPFTLFCIDGEFELS